METTSEDNEFPVGNYMFKVNKNTRAMYEICSELTMKTPELESSLLTLNIQHFTHCSSVFIVNSKQVNTGRV